MQRELAALKPYLKDLVNQSTQKSRGGEYVCPFCGSGTGPNHSGALGMYHKDSGPAWKCHACGRGGDVFDFYRELHGVTAKEALSGVQALYGAAQPSAAVRLQPHTPAGHPEAMEAKNKAYCAMAKTRVNESDYWKRRGLGDRVICRFGLGYDPVWRTGYGEHAAVWKAAIIPTGMPPGQSYNVRNTDPFADANQRYRKTGPGQLFNAEALTHAEKPVFIVEGEIDALSVAEAGGTAVGLGGLSNVRLLSAFIRDGHQPVQPVIIAPDNDGKAETEQAAAVLEREMGLLNVFTYRPDAAKLYLGAKDANEALLSNRAAFVQSLITAEEEALRAANAAPLTPFSGKLICMEDITQEEVQWLWKPFIPFGKIAILQGDPGLGKTFLALRIAAIVSTGGVFPGQDTASGALCNVIYQTAEDVLCRGCSCTLYTIKAAQAFAARTDCDPNIERSKTTWNYLIRAPEITCCPASRSQTRRTCNPSVKCTKSTCGGINPRCTHPCCSQSASTRYAGRLTKRRRTGSPQSKIGKRRTKLSSPNWSTLNGRKYAPVAP